MFRLKNPQFGRKITKQGIWIKIIQYWAKLQKLGDLVKALPFRVKIPKIGCFGRKYPHLGRKSQKWSIQVEISPFRAQFTKIRYYSENIQFRAKFPKMECCGQKYSIWWENSENGLFRSKINHSGQKHRNWVVQVKKAHLGLKPQNEGLGQQYSFWAKLSKIDLLAECSLFWAIVP